MDESTKADAAKHEENVLSSYPRDSLNGDKETKPRPEDTKVDKHGLPLVPQPSDNEDDPLVKSHSLC
jgi:hypothetical protein